MKKVRNLSNFPEKKEEAEAITSNPYLLKNYGFNQAREIIGELEVLRVELGVGKIREIIDNQTEICHRCEGEGKLWADGRAHSPNYKGETITCGYCGGSGRISKDIDLVQSFLTAYTKGELDK